MKKNGNRTNNENRIKIEKIMKIRIIKKER